MQKKELIEILNKAAYEYYQKDNSILTDKEYDKLYDELVELEKDGIIYNNSPTQKVGYEVLSQLNKITHTSPMLSLDKTKNIEKLKNFSTEEALLSWKLDGLTIVLTYENGLFISAITRGNGIIGEDVTHNAKVFYNLPKYISRKEKIIIRGEAIINYDTFEEINKELSADEKYKNPRNLCSGTIRQLSNEITSTRKVSFYSFSLVNGHDLGYVNKSEGLNFLEENGFNVVERYIVTEKDIEEKVNYFNNKKSKINYGTDGLVLTYNSYEYSSSLGFTSKFPRDSIAFKWSDELKTTFLREVQWGVSRTGIINPVAIFDTIDLEGTEVNRASLHNLSYIEELKLGINDEVSVYKANMIIPQISENFTKSNNLEIPKICPSCGEKTHIVQQKEGKNLCCFNENCKGILVDKIVHFSNRNALNIEGLSKETISKFVDNNFIKTPLDIYSLEKFENDIKEMVGFGEKSYKKLINSIEKSKKTRYPNFIYALGINGIGLANAKILTNKFIVNDIKDLYNQTMDDFINVEGFGEILSNSTYEFFSNTETQNTLNKFLEILSFEVESKSNKMENIILCITGNIEHFNNRKELSDIIENNGGKVTSSVSAKTNYLINNDINSNSSKNKKAKELNIEILTENMFIERFLA
ncbi:MAG: NAD-dependent DNA ligase LigA [Lachnospirales bacterium]